MRTMRPSRFLFASLFLATFAGGCTKPAGTAPAQTSDKAGAPLPQKLRLLVVDDPALAREIGRVRGEWEAESSAPLEIAEMSVAELSAAKTLAADAIIYPAAELGSLAERQLIQPLPEAWLNRPAYAKHDLFELVGLRETAWAGRIFAVPLGSPVMVCFYRPDLFAQFGRRPPATWAEYQKLVEFFGQRENLTPNKSGATSLPTNWSGTLEPLAPHWAGNVLLARAAAYAKHPDYYSTLFDLQTMEPRISAAPFVLALEELTLAAHAAGDAKAQLRLTPGEVREEFLTGHAAMALGWPTAADPKPRGAVVGGIGSSSLAFVELPGSPEMFNPRDRGWQRRPVGIEPHVPLLGIAGRLGSVVEARAATDREPEPELKKHPSATAEAAFNLLVWLTTKPWDRQICPASPATTLFRRSQVAEAGHWVETFIDATAAHQYAEVEARSCSRQQWLIAPRLPGHAEYMAALDDAVRRAVTGELTPQKALAAAADRWREITARHGLEAQRAAYAHSLNLEP